MPSEFQVGAPPPATYTPALPTVLTPPPAGKGVAFNAAVNLEPGYTEEEFLLSGTANIYEHDGERRLVVKATGRPYTTRILVRYPTDPARFSGVINVDFLHPEIGGQSLWMFGRDYITRKGNAYIQMTLSREVHNPLISGPPMSAARRLKEFDPVRYAAIEFEDYGVNWDIMSQVGRLIRTDSPLNPLRAYIPKQSIAGGWSGSGAVTLFYINEGFHARAKLPDGSNIYDGYLVGEPSWYPRINAACTDADDLPEVHPMQLVQPRDAPAISLYSMGVTTLMGRHRRRPDSDAPDDRYRMYMVGGSGHVGRAHLAEMAAAAVDRPPSNYPIGAFPLDHYFALTLDHLARWSAGGFTPPRAEPLQFGDDGKLALDEDRNPVGGVRSVQLDVPTAGNFPNSGSMFAGMNSARVPLSGETLRARYGDEAGYVARVTRRAGELVAEGWLLPEDVDDVVAEARAFRFPD
ncbi:MAG: alpha/beta hydrolase domain-containing protein [Phenylobacterium sp.]